MKKADAGRQGRTSQTPQPLSQRPLRAATARLGMGLSLSQSGPAEPHDSRALARQMTGPDILWPGNIVGEPRLPCLPHKRAGRSEKAVPFTPDRRDGKKSDCANGDGGFRELRELGSALVKIIDSVDDRDVPDIDV